MRRCLLLVSASLLWGGCWNPFPQCDGPTPTCHASCNVPLEEPGCYGEPSEASCIDEDGDVHWYCFEGRFTSDCPAFVDACRQVPMDSGVLPEPDAGT